MARPYKLGWIPDIPDHRDHVYAAPLKTLKELPKHVDLRSSGLDFPVYDQGRIGSCTANAIAAAVQFARKKANQKPDFIPSRLALYYLEREIEKTIPVDHGAMIRTGIKVINKKGTYDEEKWPYDDTPADEFTEVFPPDCKAVTKPDDAFMKEAAKHTGISYSRVPQTLNQLRACLAGGFPFVFGFTVYSSLWDENGKARAVVPMPKPDDEFSGGHAVLAVGYDDDKQHFIVRNSWGPNEQDQGHFYLPYAYLLDNDLADDIWTIRAMST